MRLASRSTASKIIIGSSVRPWALIQPGIKEGHQSKIHCRVPHPLERGLEVSMYAAFGKPGVIRQAPDALLAVCTNRVENDNTLGPQSHGVGPCSEGWLQ